MNASFSRLGGNIQPAVVVDDSDANAIRDRDQIYITQDLNCGIERKNGAVLVVGIPNRIFRV